MPNLYQYIDLSYLEDITDGDVGLIKELIAIFIEQIPEFNLGFSDGMQNKDWVKIAAVAHKAKSSVISMGMNDLGSYDLKNLELVAKQIRVQELQALKVRSEKEEKELVSFKNNLEGYPQDKIDWVNDNANVETVEELVNRFNFLCDQAVNELQQVIAK